MPSTWTHYEEDAYRLPDGFTRVAYDSDTNRYTFKDRNGNLYQGEPGAEYGSLMPVEPSTSNIERVRPSAFSRASSQDNDIITNSPPSEFTPKTFQEILPPELITTSTLSGYAGSQSQATSKPPRDKLRTSIRRSTLPRMQSVVTSLRRSVTSIRKPRAPKYTPGPHRSSYDEDTRHLMQHGTISEGFETSLSESTSHIPGIPESHSST